MNDSLNHGFSIPPEQQAIRDKCFHPSGTFVEFPIEDVETSIPARFEKIVRMYPDRLAVKSGNRSLTYRDLNQAANRVACAILAERGEGEEPIAFIVEQGISAIIAILGVLKAGKFYIPLDPTYPSSRLTAIIEDVQTALILTNKINLSVAIAIAHASSRVVDIEALDSSVRDQNPELVSSADTLGYLFYTSGSTGKPKGVTQSHRNILHQVMTYTNGLHISPEDRLTFLHSHGFSASRLDIFGALLNGAGLYPFSSRETGLPNMTRWLQDEEITIFHWVPSLFRLFVNPLADDDRFPNLRFIVLGSEAVSSQDVDSYKRYFAPGCKLMNRFGTTETGNIRWYFMNEQTQTSGAFTPVGYAIPDTEVFLVDESGNKVDHNQIGKICVKSRYLSPGYWRRPDLTRALFFSDPTGGNERIYVTEDLGRMCADGCLEYVGRKDSQVKIRGLRIELQEIEARLSKHPAVRQSVVKIAKGENGDDRLIAYLVPIQFQILRVKELRRHLKEELPDYMIPSVFVFLESLPLSPNGKVDRDGLPQPDATRPEVEAIFVAPRTVVEKVLAEIWAEVLNLEKVCIHDNFFDLGGHSLAATRLIYRVIQEFHLELPIKTLFESPTVAAMSTVILQSQENKAGRGDLERILSAVEAMSDQEAERVLKNPTGKVEQ